MNSSVFCHSKGGLANILKANYRIRIVQSVLPLNIQVCYNTCQPPTEVENFKAK